MAGQGEEALTPLAPLGEPGGRADTSGPPVLWALFIHLPKEQHLGRGCCISLMWQVQLTALHVSSHTPGGPFPWVTNVQVSLGAPVISGAPFSQHLTFGGTLRGCSHAWNGYSTA